MRILWLTTALPGLATVSPRNAQPIEQRRQRVALALAATAALEFSTYAGAQIAPSPPVTIIIDESGHGTRFDGVTTVPLSSAPGVDPTQGGFPNALSYISLQVLGGDVILSEDGQTPSDLIRFFTFPTNEISLSLIFFYSDNSDGADALADTGLPTFISPNAVLLPEGDSGTFYTPTANQPGFSPLFNITYHFISDAEGVPEPATWAMMLLGFGGIALKVRRSRKSAARLPQVA